MIYKYSRLTHLKQFLSLFKYLEYAFCVCETYRVTQHVRMSKIMIKNRAVGEKRTHMLRLTGAQLRASLTTCSEIATQTQELYQDV